MPAAVPTRVFIPVLLPLIPGGGDGKLSLFGMVVVLVATLKGAERIWREEKL